MSSHHAPHTPLWRRLFSPQTRLGWWSVGLAATFVLNFIYMIYAIISSTRTPFIHHTKGVFYIWAVILCGGTAAVVSLIAVIARDEHAAVIWLAIVLGLFSIVIPPLFFYNAFITI
jgi:hypothetical protein